MTFPPHDTDRTTQVAGVQWSRWALPVHHPCAIEAGKCAITPQCPPGEWWWRLASAQSPSTRIAQSSGRGDIREAAKPRSRAEEVRARSESPPLPLDGPTQQSAAEVRPGESPSAATPAISGGRESRHDSDPMAVAPGDTGVSPVLSWLHWRDASATRLGVRGCQARSRTSPRIEMVRSFQGTLRPDWAMADSAIRTRPVQQGTSMWTTVRRRIEDWVRMAASLST